MKKQLKSLYFSFLFVLFISSILFIIYKEDENLFDKMMNFLNEDETTVEEPIKKEIEEDEKIEEKITKEEIIFSKDHVLPKENITYEMLFENEKITKEYNYINEKYIEIIDKTDNYLSQKIYMFDNDGIFLIYENDITNEIIKFSEKELEKLNIIKNLVIFKDLKEETNIVKLDEGFLSNSNLLKLEEEIDGNNFITYYEQNIGLVKIEVIIPFASYFETIINEEDYHKLKNKE